MNYLSVQDLGKSYGVQTLFKGLNFGIDQGRKLPEVARNGTGKTTILRALVGLELLILERLFTEKEFK